MLGRNPWVPQFLVREVLSAETRIRRRFIERFASQAATVLPGIFESLEREGLLRDDLDPMLATLSLVGMSAFPFLVHPVLGAVFGYDNDAPFRERLIAHTARLYLEGAARAGAES